MLRLANVATPLTAATVLVPASGPPLGLVPITTVTPRRQPPRRPADRCAEPMASGPRRRRHARARRRRDRGGGGEEGRERGRDGRRGNAEATTRSRGERPGARDQRVAGPRLVEAECGE